MRFFSNKTDTIIHTGRSTESRLKNTPGFFRNQVDSQQRMDRLIEHTTRTLRWVVYTLKNINTHWTTPHACSPIRSLWSCLSFKLVFHFIAESAATLPFFVLSGVKVRFCESLGCGSREGGTPGHLLMGGGVLKKRDLVVVNFLHV